MKLYLSAVFALFLTFTASANDWKTINHRQFDVLVSLSFKKEKHLPGCYKCMATTQVAPLYFNISGPNMRNVREVRVVLTSIQKNSYGKELNRISYVVDLKRQREGHFSAEFGQGRKLMRNQELPLQQFEKKLTVHESGYGGTYPYEQEIAVVIDGHWLRNFTVDFSRH